jgi:hypothetical protein
MARDLRRRGVTHVVMEASGIYTDPVCYSLAEQENHLGCTNLRPQAARVADGRTARARCCGSAISLLAGSRSSTRLCSTTCPPGCGSWPQCTASTSKATGYQLR